MLNISLFKYIIFLIQIASSKTQSLLYEKTITRKINDRINYLMLNISHFKYIL